MTDYEYDRDYHLLHRGYGARGGSVIGPLLIDAVSPRSVIDVGCGHGGWLAAFADRGIDITGVDGPYVDAADLLIPPDRFQTMDFRREMPVGTYDLAVSVEVAEHLPPEVGPRLVDALVSLAPVVAFSAAVPGQGGEGHINERWQSEWAAEFARHEYRPSNVIRYAVWADDTMPWWYAQNLLVYSREPIPAAGDMPLDVIHPGCFEHTIRREQGGKTAAKSVLRAIRKRLPERAPRLRAG